jgi:hypothetical protein
MTPFVVLIALLGADQRVADPPSLAQPQIAQIRKLIQATKSHDAKINSQLVERQQELIAAYAEFELNEKRIERLQEEVVDLQRQLLANYHRLQMGLRKATGPERFKTVKSRADVYLRSKEGAAESDDPPSDTRNPDR